jgi:hypothetical protein
MQGKKCYSIGCTGRLSKKIYKYSLLSRCILIYQKSDNLIFCETSEQSSHGEFPVYKDVTGT